MLFLLRYYDGEVIPKKLSLKQIKKQYVRQVLADKQVKELLFKLLKKMQDEAKVYLLTDDLDEKEILAITDSSVDAKTKKPNNYAYQKLLDMQLFKEESFKQDGQNKKKLAMNNEMTFEVFNEDYRKRESRQNLLTNFVMATSIFSILFFFLYVSHINRDLSFLDETPQKEEDKRYFGKRYSGKIPFTSRRFERLDQ
jgi:hypothetical protein